MNRVGFCVVGLLAAASVSGCQRQEAAAPTEAATTAQPAGVPAAMSVAFADAAWTCDKVPDKQWCKKFGGSGATPAMTVNNVPSGTTAIDVSFNDETYQPMNNGGHGSVRFPVQSGATTANLQSVPGETDDLPAGVTSAKGHIGKDYSGTGGAYLPPCSGGMGNTYSATVKALDSAGATLGESRIVLAKY
jgi:hypothetical protein